MPSKPAVSYEQILTACKNLAIFTDNNELKKELNEIWEQACIRLDGKIKRHNLYNYVKQNRNGILNHIKCIKFGCCKSKCQHHVTGNILQVDNNNEENELGKDDDYDVLHSMAFSVRYHGIIQSICLRKFNLTYWLPEQLDLCKDLINNYSHSVASLLVIDNLVTNVKIKNYLSGKVFVIIFAIRIQDTCVNLIQSLSEVLDDVYVFSFCQRLLKTFSLSDVGLPSKLVIGYSHVLLNSVCQAFNNCSFSDYNTKCYKYILHETSDLVSTILKIDILSIIKTIDEHDYLKKKPQQIKIFYIKCIILLSSTKTLKDFEEIVLSLLVLVLSPYETEQTKKHKLNLLLKINDNTIEEIYKNYETFNSQDDCQKIFSSNNIKEKCLTIETTDELVKYIDRLEKNITNFLKASPPKICVKNGNAYFSSAWYEDKLKSLLSEFPAWTQLIEQEIHVLQCTSNLMTMCTTEHVAALNKISTPMNVGTFLKYHIEISKTIAEKGRELIYHVKH